MDKWGWAWIHLPKSQGTNLPGKSLFNSAECSNWLNLTQTKISFNECFWQTLENCQINRFAKTGEFCCIRHSSVHYPSSTIQRVTKYFHTLKKNWLLYHLISRLQRKCYAKKAAQQLIVLYYVCDLTMHCSMAIIHWEGRCIIYNETFLSVHILSACILPDQWSLNSNHTCHTCRPCHTWHGSFTMNLSILIPSHSSWSLNSSWTCHT